MIFNPNYYDKSNLITKKNKKLNKEIKIFHYYLN